MAAALSGFGAAVKKLEGVEKADVSYERRSAEITYDAAKVGVDRIIQAIGELGFKAGVKS